MLNVNPDGLSSTWLANIPFVVSFELLSSNFVDLAELRNIPGTSLAGFPNNVVEIESSVFKISDFVGSEVIPNADIGLELNFVFTSDSFLLEPKIDVLLPNIGAADVVGLLPNIGNAEEAGWLLEDAADPKLDDPKEKGLLAPSVDPMLNFNPPFAPNTGGLTSLNKLFIN